MFPKNPAEKNYLSDTPENRELLVDLASDDEKFLGKCIRNIRWYAETLENGKQLWTAVKDNLIINAGLNITAHTWNPIINYADPKKTCTTITDTLTPLQALMAMGFFLDHYYNQTHSRGLACALSDITLHADKRPFCEITWHDWINAMGGTEKSLTHLEAFTAMFNFLDAYHERTSRYSVGMQKVLDDIEQKKDNAINSVVWNDWIESIKNALAEEPQ